ncbi:hypothetical protein KA001_01365 [Patescibacteria group bacterium]|nr:hypothetical protein [Patescibacteria group bacterium]
MTPILIITKSKKLFEKEALKIVSGNELSSTINLLSLDINKYGEDISQISTSTLREFLLKKIFKPNVLNNNYSLLYNFDVYNASMQNITLKLLEESKTTIIIQSSNVNNVLDTVISRCKLIKLNQKKVYNKNLLELLDKIINSNDLSLISKLSNYEHKKVLENLEFFLKKNRNKFIEKNYIISVNNLYKLYKNIENTKALNFELQFINVIVSLLSKKTI